MRLPLIARTRVKGVRPCLALTILIFLALRAGSLAVPSEALSPSSHYKLEKIEIEGAKAFPSSAILSVMTEKQRPFYQVWKPLPDFSSPTLTDDLAHIKRFYQAHGYYDAQVSYDIEPHGKYVTVRVKIREGHSVKISALRVIIADDEPRPGQLDPSFKMLLKVGDVFDQTVYQSVAESLRLLYTSHSYAHADVQRQAIVEVARLQAKVTYEVKPGTSCVFGKTTIKGTSEVNPQLIREQLTYKNGDQFDARKLASSRDAILALNLFRAVDIQQGERPANEAVVPISILVTEGPKHKLNVGLGYNTQTQLNASLGWNDYNFLGGGRQFSLTGTYSSVANVLDAKLLQPRFVLAKASLTLEASIQQQEYQTYNATITGFDPHIDYQFSPALSAGLGWQLEYLKFNHVNESTIDAIGGFRREGILSGPFATMTFNDTEDPFNPQTGERIALRANVSSHEFGADYRYWLTDLDARKYIALGWKTVLAGRVNIGLSHTLSKIGDVPLSERFYSGGEGSVRGYGLRRIGPLSASNDPLGGLSLIETSAELRRPLFWKLNGAVFFDCGQVGEKSFDLRVDALQCGYGPAAGISSPVGPINFYLGFPTQKPRGDSSWQFYFSIGQYF